jgi:plastocyanin
VISTAGSRFNPATVTIQTGGEVTWQIVESTHNITFSSNKPQGGDVPNTSPGVSVTRVFPTPGTFDYQCTRHSGMTGQIIVQSAATPAPPAAPPAAPAPAPPAVPPSPTPTAVVTTPRNAFSPEEVQLAPGGTVTWQFSGSTHNVTFKDLAPPGGNIPNSAPGTSASRTFPAEGDYDFFCTIHDGMKGRIRVR